MRRQNGTLKLTRPTRLDNRTKRTVQTMKQALQYITDENGDRTAVVLPVHDYETLLEDLNDLAVVAGRRNELVTSHDAFIAEFERDGTH